MPARGGCGISLDRQHGSGTRLITPFAEAGTDVVLVTGSNDAATWGHALSKGARVVLSKMMPLREILSTVRRLNHGLSALDVVRRWLDQLSRWESQVLEHLMTGPTVGESAELRVVSEATVRTQVKSILAKLGVSSQIAAVSIAHKARWASA